jgi:N-hydroxyarylamine O-acetyltransferase
MSNVNLNAYFERLGFAGSIAPTLATLEALHALHPAAIPFENLDPLMGVPVLLDQQSLEQKLLRDKRGGFCFEHNTLFKRVLEDLEYEVRGYAARVLWGHPEAAVRPVSHMVLTVDIGGMTYLCDVGFGGTTLSAPLKLRADIEQATPHETFRLVGVDEGFRLDVQISGEWRQVYQFDLVEQSEEDYALLSDAIAANHRERQLLTVARTEKGLRNNLLMNRLSTHVIGEESVRRYIEDLAELKDVLATTFGIYLPAAEQLDPVLERVITTAAAEAR